MQVCEHEEVDTRTLLHLQDALTNGSFTCLVHTVGIDVVVIIIGKFNTLLTKNTAADKWIGFGPGKTFTYVYAYQCHLSLVRWLKGKF